MSNKYAVDAFDLMLRSINEFDVLFDGKVVFGTDFR